MENVVVVPAANHTGAPAVSVPTAAVKAFAPIAVTATGADWVVT